MKSYLFLTNSSKNKDAYLSKDIIKLRNMSLCCIEPAYTLGYKIYMSTNRKYASKIRSDKFDVSFYDANIYRSIFNIKDIFIAYRNLNNFLKQTKIDVIHCNTPIGGLVGRICGKKNKIDKIIYTAHGFHFYKGAPLFNNTILKFVEKILAHWTDVIITMNREDYEAAKKFKLKKGGNVYLTHGVGINTCDFEKIQINSKSKRKELDLEEDDIVLICVGDINKNKNISLLIDVIHKINNRHIKAIICGNGPLIKSLSYKAKKLGIEKQIKFLGFRDDIKELYKISDIYISTSKREGLPRSLMEAMASGLPCVVSAIRGNVDLIVYDKRECCCNKVDDYVRAIKNILNDESLKQKLICNNQDIIQNYDIKNVINEIYIIYHENGIKKEVE